MRPVWIAVSLVYFGGAWLLGLLRRWRGHEAPGSCVALYYHGLPASERAGFARQMDDLLRWSRPVSVETRGPLPSGTHCAMVTFDDGFQSVVDNALPEMRKRSIPFAMFVPSGNLGGPPRWEMEEDACDRGEVVLSATTLCSLPPDLVTVGSHSMSHPRLTSLDHAALERELAGSRAALESLLGRPVNLFAFPYGAYSGPVLEACRLAGYERVFSTVPTPSSLRDNEFLIGRISISPSDGRLEFWLKLRGAYAWKTRASRWKRALTGRHSSARTSSVPPAG